MKKLTPEKIKSKFGIDVKIFEFLNIRNVSFTCTIHGEICIPLQGIMQRKFICPSCALDARHAMLKENASCQRKSIDEWILEFREIHGEKYHYLDFDKTNSRKILVKCEEHGVFSIFRHSHIKGTGCPNCFRETQKYKRDIEQKRLSNEIENRKTINLRKQRNIERRTPQTNILEKCQKRFGNRFEYIFDNYTGIHGKFIVVCPTHGHITQRIQEHLKSVYGCHKCANYNVSNAEKQWLLLQKIESEQKVIVIDNKKFKVDGFDSDTNTIYEYLGSYWHGHPSKWQNDENAMNTRAKIKFKDLFIATQKRFEILHDQGYNIIYRWDTENQDRRFNGTLEYER